MYGSTRCASKTVMQQPFKLSCSTLYSNACYWKENIETEALRAQCFCLNILCYLTILVMQRGAVCHGAPTFLLRVGGWGL